MIWGNSMYMKEKKYLVKRKRGKRGERRGKREGGETERFVLDWQHVHVLICYLYFKCEINVNKKIQKKGGRLKWPFLRRKSFPETTIPGTRKIGRSKFSAPPLFTEIIGFGIGFGIFINFGKKSCLNVGSSQANHVKLTIFYCFLFHFLI